MTVPGSCNKSCSHIFYLRTIFSYHFRIIAIIPGAKNIEREIWELLGVEFINHPNLIRFLLSKEYPTGEYPLRKKRLDSKKA